MANEFIARKGLIVPSGSLLVTGSARITGAVTASYFVGDGSYLTNIPASSTSSVTITNHTFTGDGSQTQFDLNTPYSINSLFVSVDGMFYTLAEDYSVSGSVLIFVSAPPSQSSISVRSLINVFDGAVGTFSGSFIGTASKAYTASYAHQAGTASFALTASYVSGAAADWDTLSNKPTGIVSSSTQVVELLLVLPKYYSTKFLGRCLVIKIIPSYKTYKLTED
jgi:hypothetical protein